MRSLIALLLALALLASVSAGCAKRPEEGGAPPTPPKQTTVVRHNVCVRWAAAIRWPATSQREVKAMKYGSPVRGAVFLQASVCSNISLTFIIFFAAPDFRRRENTREERVCWRN